MICSVSSFAQKETLVSGAVKDAITGEPIIGATFIVKGRVIGDNTGLEGTFNFGINLEPPFTLIFSAVGYELREYEITETTQILNVKLRTKMIFDIPNVRQAARQEESLLQSTVSVQKQNTEDIRSSPSAHFYDGLGDLRDVQMMNNSLTFQALNMRGFASTTNPRMLQLIDGVDNSSPSLNYAYGNLLGVSPLDVPELESISSASSALYGPNSTDGVLYMTTKSPFDYTGLSAMMKNGISMQDAAGTNPFIEMAFRYAENFSDNFALKFNAAYLRGTDWQANDYTDADADLLFNPEKGRFVNPAYDGVNVYGDEYTRLLPIVTDGNIEHIRVARTGYEEEDLNDLLAESFKFDVSAIYRTDLFDIIAQYRLGSGNSQAQSFSRYKLKDVSMQQIKLEVVGADFAIRGYSTSENAGSSYDMQFLGMNLNRGWKSDNDWFAQYKAAYAGEVDAAWLNDHNAARTYADQGRWLPGSETFDTMRDSLSAITDFATGAQIANNSRLYHGEAMYDMSNLLGEAVNLVGGAHYRMYQLSSEGQYFNDADGSINVSEFGVFVQASKKLLDDRLQILLAARYDKNSNFEGNFSPRASIVYSNNKRKEHNIRVTYQMGFRTPSNQAQYLALNAGSFNVVGGAQDNINTYSTDINYAVNDSTTNTATVTGENVYNNSYTQASVQKYGTTRDANDLVAASLSVLAPEKLTSLEVGYRGVFNKRLFLDVAYFRNEHTNLIYNTNVVHPLIGNVGDASGVQDIEDGHTSNFLLYANSNGKVTAQGIAASFNLLLDLDFRLFGNYNFTNYSLGESVAAAEIPGFNTPENRFSVGLGNANIFRGIGFKLSHRWSDAYMWRSAFGTAEIPVINSTNIQFTYTVPETAVHIKVGGSNIFGNEYRTAYGLPNIGAQYFVQLTFNEF